MKQPNLEAERYRILRAEPYGDMSDFIGTNNGVFIIPFQSNQLRVIISDGEGWDHVSVSCTGGARNMNRCRCRTHVLLHRRSSK